MHTQTVPTNEQRERQIKWQNWRSALYQKEVDSARYAANLNRHHAAIMQKASASRRANYHQDKIISQNEQANEENQAIWNAYQVAVTLDTRLKSCLTPSGAHIYLDKRLGKMVEECLDYETCLKTCEDFMDLNSHLI